MCSVDRDHVLDTYDSKWTPEFSGPESLRSFTHFNEFDAGLVADLVAIDIDRSWLHWNQQLDDLIDSRQPIEVLNQFYKLPRLENYFDLLVERGLSQTDLAGLAEEEMKTRWENGDNVSRDHYQHRFGIKLPKAPRDRFLVEILDDFHDTRNTVAIHGKVTLGRSISLNGQIANLETELIPRVVIAELHETLISRNHVTIQILSPTNVYIENTSRQNPIGVVHSQQVLDSKEAICLSFPIQITLPNRVVSISKQC